VEVIEKDGTPSTIDAAILGKPKLFPKLQQQKPRINSIVKKNES
jgi:hypothetical protein